MNRPYIICHMMTSVDGRIDCAMTEHLPGVQEYYDTLDALNAPTRISGRVTAQLEMSKPGVFACDDPHPLEREGFFKAESAPGYEVVTDTRGTLLWDKPADGERPLLILTSCQASREYLDYLEGLHISWIACGGDKIDLARACEILKEEFGVQRAAVVDQGQREIDSGFCPELKPLTVDLKDYDTVVLGSPVWWYTFAPAVHSFLKEADLVGKRVYPFATNGGWLGHTLKDFAKACKGAEVKPGLDVRFDGARLRTPEQDILRWAKNIQK